MKIIFWQNIISPHQLPYIQEINHINPVYEVYLIYETKMTDDREKLGWQVINYCETVNLLVNTDALLSTELVTDKSNIHIFSGVAAYPRTKKVFRRIMKTGSKIIILSEVPDLRGLRSITRYLASFIIERKYRKYINAVLAISNMSENWYLRCGYNLNIIFPFIYCVNDYNKNLEDNINSNQIRIAYAGQLIKRKNPFILLKSLANINHVDWSLDIFGYGPLRSDLQAFCKNYNIQTKVNIIDSVENHVFRKILPSYDFLVLPSVFDGWGAVINEAIMAGIPVICSSACGASDLIIDPVLGSVFDNKSLESITYQLVTRMRNGKLKNYDRSKIKQYSQKIKGEEVAKYLIDVIEYLNGVEKERPLPPWRSI